MFQFLSLTFICLKMSGKPQLYNLVERVKVAQQIAKIAVDFDNKHDYANAAIHYRETIESLESELAYSPEANRSAISDLVCLTNPFF